MDVFTEIKKAMDECEIEINKQIDNFSVRYKGEAQRKFHLCLIQKEKLILDNLTKKVAINEVLKHRENKKVFNHVWNFDSISWFRDDPQQIEYEIKVGDITKDEVRTLLTSVYNVLIKEELYNHPRTKWEIKEI